MSPSGERVAHQGRRPIRRDSLRAPLRACTGLLLLLVAVPARAGSSLELLGPEGRVAPDPFEVALMRQGEGGGPAIQTPDVKAEGARISVGRREGKLWRFTLTPAKGAREVRLFARDGGLTASARYEIGPPTEQVALTLDPATPVKGRDREATLGIQLRTPQGAPDVEAPPPVLRANVGAIEGLERVGPGSFRARYLLPTTRYPEVAVLVAFSAWPSPASIHGATGSLVVPLSTAIDLPGHTEPGAQMSIEIAGQHFGPVVAAADGTFALPVVVPPGHRFGKGTVVDRVGNRRVEKVDLALPPTDPLSCVLTPHRIPLGTGAARVICATTDPYGHPLDAAAVTLSAERGRLTGPERAGRGLLEWRYAAPAPVTGGSQADTKSAFAPDHLEARWQQGGPLARESFEIGFEQGPADRLSIVAEEPVVFRGGSVPIQLEVWDALGLPRPDALVDTRSTEGRIAPWTVAAPGRLRSRFLPPSRGESGTARIVVSALGPTGTDPAALRTWLEGGQVQVAVVDLAGLPVPNQPLVIDGRETRTDGRGLAAFAAAEGVHRVAHGQWPALRGKLWVLDQGRKLFPSSAPVRAVEASAEVPIAPAVPVNVRIAVQGREVRYWAEDSNGKRLPGRAFDVSLSRGEPANASEENGTHRFEAPGSEPVTVSVADRETGVAAIAQVAR